MTEPKTEEKKKTWGQIARDAYGSFVSPGAENFPDQERQRWEYLAEAVIAAFNERVSVADVAALHVDQLKVTLGPLFEKLAAIQPGGACKVELSIDNFGGDRIVEAGWQSYVETPDGTHSPDDFKTPEEAVQWALDNVPQKTSAELLELKISAKREELQNLEEQLAQLAPEVGTAPPLRDPVDESLKAEVAR